MGREDPGLIKHNGIAADTRQSVAIPLETEIILKTTMRTENTMRPFPLRLLITSLGFLLLGGCGSMLPHGEDKTTSDWDSFETVKQAYDQVEVLHTGEAQLEALGFTPGHSPNVQILNHLEIVARIMPHQALSLDDVPPGLRPCLSIRNGCRAYEITLKTINSRRYGGFLADFFNFRRRTHIQGWAFHALFVLRDDQVVYKVWSGTPQIDQHTVSSNPLGPLQSFGDQAVQQSIGY